MAKILANIIEPVTPEITDNRIAAIRYFLLLFFILFTYQRSILMGIYIGK